MNTRKVNNHQYGHIFRGIINDLKRNVEAAAWELGVEEEVLEKILNGHQKPPPSLIEKAAQVWPVNERDFLPIHDDVPDGVKVMRHQESASTTRILKRGGIDYYEYRDTAMTRLASFRPEWIKILHVAEDDDANNPTVRWNNGHFLYQFTYFLGEINYYFDCGGEKRCAALNYGDSVFGMPFVRHTFASRNPEKPGIILALTYGGLLAGDAQRELTALGPNIAAQYVLPHATESQAVAALIRRHMENSSYSLATIQKLSGISSERLEKILGADTKITHEELDGVAQALRVPKSELMIELPNFRYGTSITRSGDTQSWLYPADSRQEYRIKLLAGSIVNPSTRGLEIEVLTTEDHERKNSVMLRNSLHQYGYNHGDVPLRIAWVNGRETTTAIIEPHDSFYIKPFIEHSFQALAGDSGRGKPKVIVLRTAGGVSGDTAREATLIGSKNLSRIASDSSQWYNE